MSTFLSGTALENRTTEIYSMRSNEVRTIFSVYQIWLQEGLTGTATDRHGVSDVVQTVERRMEPLVRRSLTAKSRPLSSPVTKRGDELNPLATVPTRTLARLQ